MKIYSVYDAKAEAYMPPMFFPSVGVAVRSFTAAVADEKHDFSRFAEDYVLFELGEFDDSNARFTIHPSPIPIAKAHEVKAAAAKG